MKRIGISNFEQNLNYQFKKYLILLCILTFSEVRSNLCSRAFQIGLKNALLDLYSYVLETFLLRRYVEQSLSVLKNGVSAISFSLFRICIDDLFSF